LTRNNLEIKAVLTGMPTVTEAEWRDLSWPRRWLVMVRAAVLPMTVFAALTGILAAAIDGHFSADKAIMLTLKNLGSEQKYIIGVRAEILVCLPCAEQTRLHFCSDPNYADPNYVFLL
jgi:hypothetical protein